MARSPLQEDVARLKRAEQRLRQLARPDASIAGVSTELGGGELLPALGTGSSPQEADSARAAREERLVSGTDRLRQTVTHSLEAYDTERTHQQEELVDRQRVELETEGAEREADIERIAHDQAYAKAIAESADTAAKIPTIRAPLAVIQAQLGYTDPITGLFEPGTLPPIADNDKFKQDVDKVSAAKDALAIGRTGTLTDAQRAELDSLVGIGIAPRLAAVRREKFVELHQLQAELAEIQADASRRADLAAAEVARKRLDDIESKLDALSNDTDLRFLLRDQRAQLDSVIAAQVAAAERTEAARRRGGIAKGGEVDAAGALRFGDLFGASSSHQDRAGASAAADRVAHQRQRLQLFIAADVKTAVLDAARARNIDVILVSKPMSGIAGSIAGRKDMTSDFVSWTAPGTGGVLPMKPVNPGWPIEGGGAASRPGG